MDNFDLKTNPVPTPKFMSTQVSDVRYYYLDLQPKSTSGITVVCGGRERCNPEYVILNRRFRFHSIECIAQGRGEVTIANKTFRLQAGSVFSYGPNIPHTIRNDPKNPMVKYFVDFVGTEATRLRRESPLRGGVVRLSAPGEILDIFEDLQRQGGRNAPGTPAICSTLVRLLIQKIGALAIPDKEADARALATYQRCKEQIEQRFVDFNSLAQIAQTCHVDQAYICRLFRRFDHQSPYRYLLRLKMNRAAELLMSSRLLIKELAEKLGFSDPYHFSRVFKSVHNISPVQFVNRGHRSIINR
ncbi:MAG: AraC family transcriptional regulator [Kiritimatiellae bacterium]|nr:AraC family transcriptional regulator [Kiritimatiellia bacterium]MDD5522514.1 AraC family transcriptional regulator [Kiritimatiellia bacterium]